MAFANTDGGTLYVGVDEYGRPTGDTFPEEFEQAAQQALHLCHPPVPVLWEQTEVQGAFVFRGQVRRSHTLHALTDGRVLVRAGAENRPLPADQQQRLLATRTAEEYEAEEIAEATWDDFDPDVVRGFLEAWERQRGHRPLSRPLTETFRELGWLSPAGHPTVAGLLLFGRHPQTYLPRSGLTYVRFFDAPPTDTDRPAYGRRQEIEGPLPRIIDRTWELLAEELRRGAVVTGLQRTEQWAYPPKAIREALINAVAHRDYRQRGRAIEIRLHPRRLEIVSPGGLPGYITLENIVEEHYSRNPRIVNGLYRWGYIEELGLGVDLMLDEMQRAGLPAPTFHDSGHTFTVTFRRGDRDARPTAPSLTAADRRAMALDFVRRHGRITNRDYQRLCPGVSAETLRLDLAELVKQGLLLKVGRKRGTYYILKESPD